MANMKYFSGTEEVFSPQPMRNPKFAELFGNVKAKRVDSFSMLVGYARNTDSRDVVRGNGAKPITRVIEFKRNPSLHKCDARCRNAKGHSCECSCGGQYHGAGG